MNDWIVVIEYGHLPRLAEVVENLKAGGFEIHLVLDKLGMVSGSALESDIQSLRKIPGVSSVTNLAPLDGWHPGA